MKPLELSSITEVWKSSLGVIEEDFASIGRDVQLWLKWGRLFRGHDAAGTLPPTALPSDLTSAGVHRFGGRYWRDIPGLGSEWLLSIRAATDQEPSIRNWQPQAKVAVALKFLSEFVQLEGLLGMFLTILEQRAGEQRGHWDRVRHMSVAIARCMGFSGRSLVEVELAGLLHDIGKVALPTELLGVMRPLTDNERRQIEIHSTVGAGMVRETPGLENVAEAILAHHEACDGSGYPRGLRGDAIPMAAAIVAVADAFDAMTHYRPYAGERTYRESIDEMAATPGKFKPEVLEALQKVLADLGILETKPMVSDPLENTEKY